MTITESNGTFTFAATDTNTDTKVTSVDNHYTPTANTGAELTATLSGTAGAYAKDKEYTVLTGVKAQRDAKGHVTGLTYTAQKIKDTNTDTNTSHSHSAGVGLVGSGSAGTSGTYTYKAKLRSETALTVDSAAATTTSGRVYPVAVDKSGYLSVNVPWTDTNTDTDTHYTNYLQIKGNGTEAVKFTQNADKTLNLKPGNNVSISAASGEITISATDTKYTFNGAVSTIKDSNLTASRALISNSSGKVAVSDVTSTELSYLDGVTSSIQTQLNAKSDKTTYEWNKEFAAGSNGAISLGRYNIYDSQLTFDITSTTNQSLSGKLVIATQNGTIHQAKVFGDAAGELISKLIIYQSAISNSRS